MGGGKSSSLAKQKFANAVLHKWFGLEAQAEKVAASEVSIGAVDPGTVSVVGGVVGVASRARHALLSFLYWHALVSRHSFAESELHKKTAVVIEDGAKDAAVDTETDREEDAIVVVDALAVDVDLQAGLCP